MKIQKESLSQCRDDKMYHSYFFIYIEDVYTVIMMTQFFDEDELPPMLL